MEKVLRWPLEWLCVSVGVVKVGEKSVVSDSEKSKESIKEYIRKKGVE